MSRTLSFRLDDDEAEELDAEANALGVTMAAHVAGLVRSARSNSDGVKQLAELVNALNRQTSALELIASRALPPAASAEQFRATLEQVEHMRLVTLGGAPDQVAAIEAKAKAKADELMTELGEVVELAELAARSYQASPAYEPILAEEPDYEDGASMIPEFDDEDHNETNAEEGAK